MAPNNVACSAVGVGLDEVKNGLELMQGVKGRLELKKGKSGSCIIDDTYNANRRFAGALDDMRFYDKALSAEELAKIKAEGKQ